MAAAINDATIIKGLSMTDNFPECEQLQGRLRAICRGEILTPEKCDGTRRALWNLPPRFTVNADAPTEDQALTTKSPQAHIRLCNKRRGSSSTRGKPGTVFKRLALSLGVKMPPGCYCNAVRNEMDRLGTDGCRRERARLLNAIRNNAAKLSWVERISAAAAAVTSGLAFHLDPIDPLGSLFDEALRRTEAEAATETTQPIS